MPELDPAHGQPAQPLDAGPGHGRVVHDAIQHRVAPVLEQVTAEQIALHCQHGERAARPEGEDSSAARRLYLNTALSAMMQSGGSSTLPPPVRDRMA